MPASAASNTPTLRGRESRRSRAFLDNIGASWVLFTAAILGCGTPPPPPVQQAPIVVTPPVATAEVAAAAPEPDVLKGPFDVVFPKDPACLVTGAFRPRKVDSVLRVAPHGPSFAEALGGQGTLHFPAGPRPAQQGLELEADGLAVRGYMSTDVPALSPSEPTLLSGFALTSRYVLFDWTDASPGKITVTAPSPPGLQVLSPPLTAVVPCSGVSLESKDFDATSVIEGYKKAKPRQLTLDHPVDISLTPGGSPVARAIPSRDTVDVSLLATKGKDAKIAWEIGRFFVVGWVKIADVHIPKDGYAYGTGRGLGGPPRYEDIYKKVVCPMDVDLWAQLNGEKTYLVGKIRRGTVIELTSVNDKLTRVRVRSEKIKPTVDAWWSVFSRDLDTCEAPKP